MESYKIVRIIRSVLLSENHCHINKSNYKRSSSFLAFLKLSLVCILLNGCSDYKDEWLKNCIAGAKGANEMTKMMLDSPVMAKEKGSKGAKETQALFKNMEKSCMEAHKQFKDKCDAYAKRMPGSDNSISLKTNYTMCMQMNMPSVMGVK